MVLIYPLFRVDHGAMVCEEKARLVDEYSAAALAFSKAVQELRRRIGASPREEYKRIEQTSNEAHVKCGASKTSA